MNPCITDSVPAGSTGTETAKSASDGDLRERADLFVQLASSETLVLWVADLLPEPRRVSVSPAVEAVWGYSPDQVYGRAFSGADAVHPEDALCVLQAFEAWIANPLAHHDDMSYRNLRPGGGIRWVHDAPHVARMQALDALGIERDRLAHVVATAPSVTRSLTLGADRRLHFDLGTDHIAHLYGVTEEEARQDSNAVFAMRLHPDEEPVARAAVRPSVAAGTPWRVDYRILHR